MRKRGDAHREGSVDSEGVKRFVFDFAFVHPSLSLELSRQLDPNLMQGVDISGRCKLVTFPPTANRPPSVHSPFAPVSLSNSASDVFCSRSAWNAPIAPVNAVNRLPLTMNDRTNEGVAPAKKAPKPPRPITSLAASTNPTLPTEPFHPPPPKHCPCTPDLTQSNGKFASHPAAPATPPAIAVAAAWLTPRSRLYTKHAVSLIAYTGIKMNVPEPVHHVFKRGEEHRVEHALTYGVDAVP